jgi:octaprenyl-diphosphate synthase
VEENMRDLNLLLDLEQPRINAVLDRYAAELPAGARPVASHVLLAGGKRLRPLLTLLVGQALGGRDVSLAGLFALGAAVELLHAATLLHDDILDNAHLRRGRPAAHKVFAPSTVVLAGDAMLAKAMLIVSSFGDTRLTDCISEAVMRTAEGEIAEFACLRNPDLSEEDYLAIITGKTAWLLRAACELGAVLSGAKAPLVRAAADFGLELGIAFQIVDDALDFSPPSGTGKPTGGDLREGKVTPPLQLYMASLEPEEAASFKKAFSANSLAPEQLEAIREKIFSGGFAARSRQKAQTRLAAALAALRDFPASGERLALERMADYVLRREQ